MNKKAIISEYLPWLLIGIAVLVLLMISIYFLGEKSFGIADRIREIFRR